MLKALRRAADRRRHAQGDYAWLFHPYTGEELVAIDCESTHPDPRLGELVAIAAVRIRGDRVLTSDSLSLRLRPPASLGEASIRVHGLRGIDLADGMHVDTALARLLEFVGNRPLVGWYLERDLTLLNRYLRPHFGFDLPNVGIDVAQTCQRRLRRHPDLEVRPRFIQAAEWLDVPVMGRHSALGNAVTTALMYLRLERAAAPSRQFG